MNLWKAPVLDALARLLLSVPIGMTVLVSEWTVTAQVAMTARQFVLTVEVQAAVALVVQANVVVVVLAAMIARARPWPTSIRRWKTTLQIRRMWRAMLAAR